MPAVWDESSWAVFGALLRADGFSQEEAVKHVNCSDMAVKQANRVRVKGARAVWIAVVAKEVTIADAEALVKRFEGDHREQTLALKRLRDGEITKLRHHQVISADGATAFQDMMRRFRETPAPDWSLTEEQMAEGVELAEAGLAEDAETWPGY